MTDALNADIFSTEVSGPLPNQRVRATWAMSRTLGTAIIEMASAAGLMLVHESQRDPKITTTLGVGELIREALNRGASSIIVGIGGSATNDGGAGMAEALGVRFLDHRGRDLPRGGIHLGNLARVDVSALDRRLGETRIVVACDVQNPLAGEQGASRVFAPQKGANTEDARLLDEALLHYGRLIGEVCGRNVGDVPGAGAAGGLGAGLLAFCNADLKKGIDLVLDATGFDEDLATTDLVITGEGKIDAQTRLGKAPAGVLRRARAAGKPVAALAGGIEGDRSDFVGPNGFLDLAVLVDEQTTREEAMHDAAGLVRRKTKELIGRLRD
jgi:glycerate kinase